MEEDRLRVDGRVIGLLAERRQQDACAVPAQELAGESRSLLLGGAVSMERQPRVTDEAPRRRAFQRAAHVIVEGRLRQPLGEKQEHHFVALEMGVPNGRHVTEHADERDRADQCVQPPVTGSTRAVH